MSADSVVPGSASGGMDGVALKPLTVDFHEPGFASKLGEEHGFAFWFQLSDDDKQKSGSIWGPSNPQALNRYSYVWNSPLRYADPQGHWTFQLSFGGMWFDGAAGRGGVTFAIDGQGNFAIFGGGGGGVASSAGGSGGLSFGATNAPSVASLEGGSIQIGGQIGEVLGINVEGVFGSGYSGVNVGGRATLTMPLPAEFHITGTYDQKLYSVNIGEAIAKPFIYIGKKYLEWTEWRRNSPNPLVPLPPLGKGKV